MIYNAKSVKIQLKSEELENSQNIFSRSIGFIQSKRRLYKLELVPGYPGFQAEQKDQACHTSLLDRANLPILLTVKSPTKILFHLLHFFPPSLYNDLRHF